MTKRNLEKWQEKVSIDFLPPEHIRTVIALLLDHLKLDIVCEQTPDYTTLELRPRIDT